MTHFTHNSEYNYQALAPVEGGMPYADVVALKANFEKWQETRGQGLKKPFDFYCFENFLKSYPVSDKEIQTGAVDQSLDGGIDAFYFFANRKYVFENPTLDADSDYRLSLVIFQCKEGAGFSQVEIGKMQLFTEDLLNLQKGEADYAPLYHSKLRALMSTFKSQWNQVAGSVTQFDIQYYYISKLDCDLPKPHDEISVAADKLVSAAKKYFPKADVHVEFVNAHKLYEQVKKRRQKTKKLTHTSQHIQCQEGWIGLVKLRDFYEFLKDEHGAFHEEILEENVRGFVPKSPVNGGIAKSLRDPNSAEFWLLNNGITILAAEVNPALLALNIKDPQIVNGLQTSRTLFKYFEEVGPLIQDDRRVLVRVIQTADESVRDQITNATNSQNKMPPEALRATDEIHRKIEEVFGHFGLFYDRRKNHYKNLGKPAAQIVSVRDVIQATVAIALRRPSDARGRPGDYLKDEKYPEIFGADSFHIMTYLKCTEIVRRIEKLSPPAPYDEHALNLLFYVALYVTARVIGNAHIPPLGIQNFDIAAITDEAILQAYEDIYKIYEQHGKNDKAAKGADMENDAIQKLKEELHG